MRASVILLGALCSLFATAAPVPYEASAAVKRYDEVDGDDAVVYAWKVPTAEKVKREEVEVDGDDAVVYAWKVPTSKE